MLEKMEIILIVSLMLVSGVVCGGLGIFFSINTLFKHSFGIGIFKWLKETKNKKDRYKKVLIWLQNSNSSLFELIRCYLVFIDTSILLLTVNLIVLLIIFFK